MFLYEKLRETPSEHSRRLEKSSTDESSKKDDSGKLSTDRSSKTVTQQANFPITDQTTSKLFSCIF